MYAILLAAVLSAEPPMSDEAKLAAYEKAQAAAAADEVAKIEKWLGSYELMVRRARLARNGKMLAALEKQRREYRKRSAALKSGDEKASPKLNLLLPEVGACGIPGFEKGELARAEVAQVNSPTELVVQCYYRRSGLVGDGRGGVTEDVGPERKADTYIVRGRSTSGLVDGAELTFTEPMIVSGTTTAVIDLAPVRVFVLEPVKLPPERVQPAP